MEIKVKKTTGKGKKGRKIGRNVAKCKRYRDEGRRSKNRRKRLLRAAKRYEQLALRARKLRNPGRMNVLQILSEGLLTRAVRE